MKLSDLAPAKGARKVPFRKGRGIGSGWGKTAGRGYKGQGARSGGTKGVAFEGGQLPIAQKIPKRGFTNPFRVAYEVVNLKDLARFKSGETVDPAALHRSGLVTKRARVKILGDGAVPAGLTIKAHAFSKPASEKLTAAGAKIEVLG